MSKIITVRNLTKKFPSHKSRKIKDRLFAKNKTYKIAADSISFEIERGESVAWKFFGKIAYSYNF
jgi:ABC-type oligopeptide transport system ATPase subunit